MRTLFTRLFPNLLAILAWSFVAVSCDNILAEEEEDCSIHYRVKFKYDYNMKYADAFANEVNSVTLYAFDDDGKLVFQKTEEDEILKSPNYYMELDINPGDYRLITWAGRLDEEASFSVPLLTVGESTYEELICKMDRAYTRADDNGAYINTELTGLWHGEIPKQNFSSRAALIQTAVIPLVKNTNRIRIILQQLSDGSVDASKFDYTITDDNGLMNYDNSILEDELLTYMPWHQGQGSSSINGVDLGTINVAVAELTTGRLMADKNPILTITNRETGKVVLSIPLVKYLLLTEAEGHDMAPQEYLDRQDEYSLTFFVDANMAWINTQIIINGWIVRYNNIENLN